MTLITPQAQWTWQNKGTNSLKATGYPPTGLPTKSGLMPQDLVGYIGVPLVTRLSNGTIQNVPSSDIIRWIRWAEDMIEQDCNIRLCPTWIAAPAAKENGRARSLGMNTANSYAQALGVDYDMEEPAYDYVMSIAEDNGWMEQRLRWRPVQGPNYTDQTGLKNYAFIYPTLSSNFNVAASWFVVDKDYGIVRLVPNTNSQMLPLFALQISFQGFTTSVPGGIWMQYVAGLTANDYNSEYSFMGNYVLAMASITALGVIQGSLNFGVTEQVTTVDGLMQKIGYSQKGPYSGLITSQQGIVDNLRKFVKMKMGGVAMVIL